MHSIPGRFLPQHDPGCPANRVVRNSPPEPTRFFAQLSKRRVPRATIRTMPKRVVLAMSGGVDSSAAAVILKEAGHEVIGLFMRSGVVEEACAVDDNPLPIVQSHKQGCCSASDAADARRVSDVLDIPFHAVNFRGEFGRIMDYFADEYLAGRTPNPCVRCNHWIKFGALWDFADSVGADAIATGHYAQIDASSGPALLHRGVDRKKDQSYVLFGIRRELLERVIFPVGGYEKPEIRQLAERAGLRTANKPDSQEICFVPDNDYAAFVERHRGRTDTSGDLVLTDGTVVGQHAGYEHFTIGQRKGLGVAFGEPRFVTKIDADTKQVVIGTRNDLACHELTGTEANWHDDVPSTFRARAQIRYQHDAAWCDVNVAPDRSRFDVTFDEPQFGVAPGQAVVLYDDTRVIGGAWIA